MDSNITIINSCENPLLTICIASLESRKDTYERLLNALSVQLDRGFRDKVEIISYVDDKKITVGKKRQSMLHAANGKYISHIDDDDMPDESYIHEIIGALESDPDIDIVTFKSIKTEDGQNAQVITYRLDRPFAQLRYNPHGFTRHICHLCVVKTEHARRSVFPDKNRGEDEDWARDLLRLKVLKKEKFIDKVLYNYLFSWSKTETQTMKKHKKKGPSPGSGVVIDIPVKNTDVPVEIAKPVVIIESTKKIETTRIRRNFGKANHSAMSAVYGNRTING